MSRKDLLIAALVVGIAGAFSSTAEEPPRYQFEVFLHRVTVLKVVEAPGDTQEDLFGQIAMVVASDVEFAWNARKDSPLQLGQGQSRSFSSSVVSPRLSRPSLSQFTFLVTGEMNDAELFTTIRYKPCDQCGSGTGRVIRMENLLSQIDTIPPGGSKYMKFGSDDTFQLDWYEGDANSSHVRALFKVRVSRVP